MNSASLILRPATAEDASALLSIYTPYVEKTAITFEYEVPGVHEFRERIVHTLKHFPYVTALRGGLPVGYAYVSPFKERAAYDWAVETSIYVAEDARGGGIGLRLYHALEELLKLQNILNLNACIAYPNPGSILFHEKLGYKTVAHFSQCGYKLDRWWDMVWMEKMLGEHPQHPLPVIPFPELPYEQVQACLKNQ